MRKFFALEFILFLIGLFSLIFKEYFLILFLLYMVGNALFTMIYKLDLFQVILSIFMFPYFPLIQFFILKGQTPHYVPLDFEYKPIETINPSYKTIDLAPFHVILKYGDKVQKKEAIKLILELTSKEEIDFNEGLKMIYTTISKENDQDVILYATEASNYLEKILLRKLYESKDKNSVDYARYSYYYANSPFLEKEQKIELLNNTKKFLEDFIKKYPYNIDALTLLIKILEELEEHEKIEKLLELKLSKIKSRELFEIAILYFLKYRKHSKVKELLTEFNSYKYTFKNESLKILLEG